MELVSQDFHFNVTRIEDLRENQLRLMLLPL